MGRIYCGNDDCFGPRTTGAVKEDAIRQWNTRAVNSHEALVKALMDVAARADFELSHPTEMRDTAFSLISKSARAALSAAKGET
jgi:hypothetical protein